MAHSMLVYPEEVARFNFERSNFVAEISPYQLWVPDPAASFAWSNLIGGDLFNLTFTPIRTLVDVGAVVTYGSDWDNVPEPDPWFALQGMITRAYPGKPEYGRLNPDERVPSRSRSSGMPLLEAVYQHRSGGSASSRRRAGPLSS